MRRLRFREVQSLRLPGRGRDRIGSQVSLIPESGSFSTPWSVPLGSCLQEESSSLGSVYHIVGHIKSLVLGVGTFAHEKLTLVVRGGSLSSFAGSGYRWEGGLPGTALWKGFQKVVWPGSSTALMSGAPTSKLQANSSLQQEHIVFWPCSPTQSTLNADPAANSYF